MNISINPKEPINYSLISSGLQYVVCSITIPRGKTATAYISGGISGELSLKEGTTTDVSPPLNAIQIAGLGQPLKTQVVVTCNDGARETRDIVVLPLCARDQRREYAKATAAFVLENDPFVLRIVRKAGVSPSPSPSPLSVHDVAEHLYNRLAESFEACYLYERAVLPDHNYAQIVRFPAQMHYEAGGTCDDLVFLFAAVFRRAGLDPVLLTLGDEFGDRHALIAVWDVAALQRGKVARPGKVMLAPGTLLDAVQKQHLLVIEATWLTQDKPFDQAVREGRARALNDKILWGIDVATARDYSPQIPSLPEQPCTTILSGIPARITDAFTTTRAAEAAKMLGNFTLKVVASGDIRDKKGKLWPLEGYTVRLGRSPHNYVQLHDSSVSREHAVIFVKENRLFLKDLGSNQGTTIRDTALEPYLPYVVNNGQTFKLGDVELQLSIHGPNLNRPHSRETTTNPPMSNPPLPQEMWARTPPDVQGVIEILVKRITVLEAENAELKKQLGQKTKNESVA